MAFSMLYRSVSTAALCASLILFSPLPANAADNCNCVAYVRSQTGLGGGPGTAAGYTEGRMRQLGYRRVPPAGGTILVWDANQKGAFGAGHIAIVNSASYDSRSKKWNIAVRHANWGGCGIRTNTFSWGDLYGVNAYRR